VIKIKGEYEFYQGGTIKGTEVIGGKLVYKFHNIICTPVYEYILKSLNYSEESTPPGASDIDVSHFAFGTGTTTPAITNTTLGNEVYRKGFTSKSWNTNQFTAICQLATDEGNFSLTEVGVFSNGSLTADSGTLLSHALKTIEKNANITYNIIYRLTLEEV